MIGPPAARPKVVAFDIVETVFRIEALGPRLAGLGLPEGSYARLYAEALRDAVALACIGGFAPFVDVFAGALGGMLAEAGLPAEPGPIRAALLGLRELPPHPDAAEAFRLLARAGIRVFALSNGAESSTRALLDRAGMSGSVEAVLSVETVRLFKPRREVYGHAVAVAGVRPEEMTLVACHPWDITGAKKAGLRGAFVARGKPYPATMTPPDLQGDELLDVARLLIG